MDSITSACSWEKEVCEKTLRWWYPNVKVRRTDMKEDLLKDAVLFPDGESDIGSMD